MKTKEAEIKKILLDRNYVREKDIKRADEFAKRHHLPFTEYLFRNELVTKDLLGQAIAESTNLSYADLNSFPPSYEQVHGITEETAKKNRIVIFKEEGSTFFVLLPLDSVCKEE